VPDTQRRRSRPGIVPLELEMAAEVLLQHFMEKPDFFRSLSIYRARFHEADLRTRCAVYLEHVTDDPEYQLRLALQDPDQRRESAKRSRSESLKLLHKDPGFKKKLKQGFKAYWTDKTRTEHSEAMHRYWTPENRAKLAARNSASWTPERKASQSAGMKAKHAARKLAEAGAQALTNI